MALLFRDLAALARNSDSQHLHGFSQLSVTPVKGDLMPPWAPHTQGAHKYMQSKHSYIHKIYDLS